MLEKTKPGLRLVYSVSWDRSIEAGDEKPLFGNEWIQLELFPSNKKDLVIFTHPERSTLSGILDFLFKNNIRHVFDLRELPVLAFENISRDEFLDILEKHDINYITVQSFVRKVNQTSAHELFQFLCSSSLNDIDGIVKATFKKIIEGGPTLVFTDDYPAKDQVADDFRRSLVCSGISFSPLFAIGQT